MYDKASRLKVIVRDSSGGSKPSQKGDIHFKGARREMTPREFLDTAPKNFKCDLYENDTSYTLSFTLIRETKFCLYYIGELGIGTREFYVAPLYIFKKPSKFANEMMKMITLREEEASSIISGAHFHHYYKDRLKEGQHAPDPFLECFRVYFNFKLHTPMSKATRGV